MSKSGVIGSLALLALLVGGPALASPKSDYMLNCMGCHLIDGAGTPEKVPALKGQVAKFLHIDGGRAFLVQVPGTSQSALDNARTAEVLNYILTEFDKAHLPSDFQPYTEEEVATLRPQKLSDVMSVRADLIQGTDIK